MRDDSRGITTLVFDWDGTLFDSASAGFIAFQQTFHDLGIDFTREFYDSRYSPNWYAMYDALNLSKENWNAADELWLQHYGEQPPRMVDAAETTIRELHRKGYRLGIVTSGTERRVSREIELLDLSSIFEVVICNEHIENKKPHPEGLEKAMSLIASSREASCYIGDAPEDVQMGKNAQVFTVGVRSSYPTSKHLLNEQPDILIESIGDLLIHF